MMGWNMKKGWDRIEIKKDRKGTSDSGEIYREGIDGREQDRRGIQEIMGWNKEKGWDKD